MVDILFDTYFAGCRLQTEDACDFLANSPLRFFEKALPYDGMIKLTITQGIVSTFEPGEYLVECSGIRVGKTDGGSWLLSSSDQDNSCCIQASLDYSELRGQLGPLQDAVVMSNNFMQLLRVAIECYLAYHGRVSLHASCAVSQKEAILFSAPSGAGKSTQANLWVDTLNATILSGDRPTLQHLPDQVWAHGVPWDGEEQIFIQESYPAKAIVEVRRAKDNYLRRLSVKQAVYLLMKQCFIPMWDDTAKFMVMETIKRTAQRLPFYRLFCLPEERAVHLVQQVLYNNCMMNMKEVLPDMKLKDGFILRNVVDEWVVMPTGQNVKEFDGAIMLNDVSAFIWQQLETSISREDLLAAILEEYDIDTQQATADLDELLKRLRSLDILTTEDA